MLILSLLTILLDILSQRQIQLGQITVADENAI